MPPANTRTLETASPFSAEADDAEAFLADVEVVASGLCTLYRPTQLHIVRIDNWFGPRWLRFSGKVHGAFGIARRKLTLPPFVPSRVVAETTLERHDDEICYSAASRGLELHLRQASSANLSRYTQDLAPTTAILWFSGASSAAGRGAIMAHVPAEGFHWSWYVGLAADLGWGLSTHNGISPVEFRHLRRAGETGST